MDNHPYAAKTTEERFRNFYNSIQNMYENEDLTIELQNPSASMQRAK